MLIYLTDARRKATSIMWKAVALAVACTSTGLAAENFTQKISHFFPPMSNAPANIFAAVDAAHCGEIKRAYLIGHTWDTTAVTARAAEISGGNKLITFSIDAYARWQFAAQWVARGA